MANWVFYFCEVAAMLQVASKVLSWKTKGLWQRLAFGAAAFTLLVVGFALAQISSGDDPRISRELLETPLRIMFFFVGLLWILEGVADIVHGVKIVDRFKWMCHGDADRTEAE